jgi:rhodanese-related sulfurtransferase
MSQSTTIAALGPVRIDAGDLKGLLGRRHDVKILDVRSSGEFAAVHVPGSVNVPLEVLHQHHREVSDAVQQPLVLMCAQGVRSEEAARVLAGDAVNDIRVLAGGVNAWAAAGGDVVRGRGHWAMERQVRLVAGTLVTTSVLVSVVASPARWVAAGVGAGLTYSALSNTCAMARVLGLLPYNRSMPGYDLQSALAELRA